MNVKQSLYICYNKTDNNMKMHTHFEIMEMTSIIEVETLMKLAIGRVFRMLERPFKEGDSEVFEQCSNIVKSCGERLEILKVKEFFYDKTLHDVHNISTSILF